MVAPENSFAHPPSASAVAPAHDLLSLPAMSTAPTYARHRAPAAGFTPNRRGWSLVLGHWSLAILLWAFAPLALASTTNSPSGSPRAERGLGYHNDLVPEYPWSVHVVKLDRSRKDYAFGSSLGGGGAIGMSTLSEQIKALPADFGTPVAALNADFYNDERNYVGDPRDLQVRNG